MEKILSGRSAIITGGSHGLGYSIAAHFLNSGADVMLCARGDVALEEARIRLERAAPVGRKIVTKCADVSVETEARAVFERALAELGGCHVLVNNAGIYGPKGETEFVDSIEWIRTFEVNVFGSVLMSRAVLPYFKNQGYGKIIQISGGGATSPMPRLSAYAASKAAIVRYAETLAEELRGTGIDVNSLAPGALNTRMLDEVIRAGPEKVGQDFYDRAIAQSKSGGTPMDKGALLATFLASRASDGLTGKLISAVWDAWEKFPNHLNQLSNTDVFTLRRISGKDRGLSWADK